MELHCFDSFGEFESAVVDVDLAVRLLGPRDGKWRIGNAHIDGITVQQGVELVPNLCEASGWPTHLLLLISGGHPSPTWLNGVPFSPDTVGVLAPRQGFVFRAAGPNAWVSIALPLSSPLFHADDEAGHVLRQWCQSTKMVPVAPSAIQALRRVALAAVGARVPRATGRAAIETAIIGLVASRREQAKAIGRPSVSPHGLCDATLGLFRSIDDGGVPGSGRFDSLPIGARSLNSFFHHCFGQGPAQYLQLRRLHAIHAVLKDLGSHAVSITDIFERHEYSYSTYALARYRAVFGETPSNTRARAVGTASARLTP